MKKLYQFLYSTTEMGAQIEITFCAWTWKQACTMLNINMYTAKNYVHRFEPQNKECIAEPLLRYGRFSSGELCYGKPEWRGKLIKLIELQNFINEYRKIYPTYRDTMEHFDKKNLV